MAGLMQAQHRIVHRRWSEGGTDPYGNPVASFSEVPVWVFAWWVPSTDAPRAGDEVATAGRDGVLADVTFLAPDFEVDDRDEFIIPEFAPEPLRVVGEKRSYDHGPFGYRPGMQVALKFAEG